MVPAETEGRRSRDAWEETVLPFGPPGEEAARVFADLAARHAEPARHYHTLAHVAAMWGTLEWLRGQVVLHDLAAVRLAVWFHDAVYDPQAGDSEEQSAALALALLPRLRVPPERVAAVGGLIRATKTHRAAPDDPDCQALLDCDLAVLGAEAADYDAYAAAIRREYAWVPDADFRAGRGKVLASFLERAPIYHTPPMRARLEEAARRNLERERGALL